MGIVVMLFYRWGSGGLERWSILVEVILLERVGIYLRFGWFFKLVFLIFRLYSLYCVFLIENLNEYELYFLVDIEVLGLVFSVVYVRLV